MVVIHVCGFFAILIPLWVLAPKKIPGRLVFTEFQNNGGWPCLGLSCLIEITGLVYSLTEPNSAMHMCKASEPRRSKLWLLTPWERKRSEMPRRCFP